MKEIRTNSGRLVGMYGIARDVLFLKSRKVILAFATSSDLMECALKNLELLRRPF